MRSETAEEPPVAVISPIVATLFALEGTELVLRTVQMFAPPRLRWDAVAYPFLPLAAAMMFPGVLAARAGRPGWLMLACGLGIDALLVIRFRGLWTWDGSFDHEWTSPHRWMAGLLGGAVLGFILGRNLKHRRSGSSRGLLGLMVSTLSVAFVNWTLAHVWSKYIDSFFPPTRLFATGGILFALGVLWYVRTLDTETSAV